MILNSNIFITTRKIFLQKHSQLTPVDLHLRKRIEVWSKISQKSGVLAKMQHNRILSLFAKPSKSKSIGIER